MTFCASGVVDFESCHTTIEHLVAKEARRNVLPGMSVEDVAQEIRVECWKSLQHYDTSRIGPYPYKFLQVCVKNFLFNMRRGIYIPNNPPCVRCPMWDRLNKSCLIKEEGCQAIVEYRKNMALKAEIKCPATLEVDIADSSFEDEIDAKFLHETIRSKIPKNLLKDFDKMISGNTKKISAKNKKQIRLLVKDILDELK